MRPKTFPATAYAGNSRQRLQEIREGLKQPPKAPAPGPPVGPGDSAADAKALGGKDGARRQPPRAAPRFGPHQKALREIRYSLLPFATEPQVNRQMLQELVGAGCDQVGGCARPSQHPGASRLPELSPTPMGSPRLPLPTAETPRGRTPPLAPRRALTLRRALRPSPVPGSGGCPRAVLGRGWLPSGVRSAQPACWGRATSVSPQTLLPPGQ